MTTTSKDDATVWLAVPCTSSADADVCEPLTSRLGGRATYFRVCRTRSGGNACDEAFACPSCRACSAASLLAQVSAPLHSYDRVLYVLLCTRCTRRDGTSVCYAVRSQNYNSEYAAAATQHDDGGDTTTAQRDDHAPLFDVPEAEADDWGDDDDDDDNEVQQTQSDASAHRDVQQPHDDDEGARVGACEVHTSAVAVPLGGDVYTPCVPLEWCSEPPKRRAARRDYVDDAQALEARYDAASKLDTTSVEHNSEGAAERLSRKYLARLARAPTQCARWSSTPSPLYATVAAASSGSNAAVPACAACGAPRQHELQLTAPAVFFLTRARGEAANAHVHFSNVHVYTCSACCYAADRPYTREHVVVEDEL